MGCSNKNSNNVPKVENSKQTENNQPVKKESGNLYFLEDFEDNQASFQGYEGGKERSFKIVQDVVRKGKYAFKITVHPDDITQVSGKDKKNRAEAKYDNLDPEGSEVYYGWSFLIPNDYIFKPEDGSGFNIIAQWHDKPDRESGETREQTAGLNPPIAVYMGTLDGQPGIRINYGLRDLNVGSIGDSPIKLDDWNDIVFHIKWSQGEDGFVEVWHNDKSITGGKVYGPNMHNSVPHYWKTGFYRGIVGDDSTLTTNSMYIDEIRIGRSKADVSI